MILLTEHSSHGADGADEQSRLRRHFRCGKPRVLPISLPISYPPFQLQVGGDVFDACVRCVAPLGNARLLVIGFAGGRIPTLPVNMALIKVWSRLPTVACITS